MINSLKINNFLYKLYLFGTNGLEIWNIFKEYRFIKKNLNNSIENSYLIQKERLFKILNFAIIHVPYYKKIAKKNGIRISLDTIFEDIKQFPILTKEIIRRYFNYLHPDNIGKKWIINNSGGTTGEPVKIIQDRKFSLKALAANIAFDEIGEYFLGDKLLKLWGNEKEIFNEQKGIITPFINQKIKRIQILNAFRMSDNIMFKYSKFINNYKPNSIIAYVQSIYELAKYIKRKNIKINPINSIIVSAGVLTNDVRIFLEDVFHCKVFNRYGSREIGMIATSCRNNDKLHINMFQQYIEILDNDNNPLKPPERGNIIITNMINFGMPLIRYEIGDRGSLDDSHCQCNRGLIFLNNVFGRIVDVFKTNDGKLIDGEYFTHLFYFRHNVKKFQIIQEKLDQIEVNIVTLNKKELNAEDELDIEKKIKLVMGNTCKVKFNYVSDIIPSSSGKLRYTISKI